MGSANARSSGRRRLLLAATGVVIAALGLKLYRDPKGLRLWTKLGADLARLDTENAKLRAQVADLRRQARAIRGDPAGLERAARESGYVKNHELLFELR